MVLQPDGRSSGPALPSNRSFGAVFSVAALVAAFYPLIEGAPPRWWAAAAAAILIVLTVVWPRVLQPANAAWFRLGRLLHRLVSPIIMAALFYLVVTPVGLVRQRLGRGAAPSLRRNASARSYWTTRSGFSPMNQQF